MKTTIKAAVFALLGIALLAVAPLAPIAGTADAAPRVQVGGGIGIVLDGRSICTLTAIGHDRSGRLVGLTAAHCGPEEAVVTAEKNRAAGALGVIVQRNPSVDTAVIAFDPAKVQPVRQVGPARISSVGRFPANTGANVCKSGRSTGYTCGPVLYQAQAKASSYVCAGPGDSGGPVIEGDRVVAMLNGGEVLAGITAVPCFTPAFPVFSPMRATKMTDIVTVLNAQGAAGAGFRPI